MRKNSKAEEKKPGETQKVMYYRSRVNGKNVYFFSLSSECRRHSRQARAHPRGWFASVHPTSSFPPRATTKLPHPPVWEPFTARGPSRHPDRTRVKSNYSMSERKVDFLLTETCRMDGSKGMNPKNKNQNFNPFPTLLTQFRICSKHWNFRM